MGAKLSALPGVQRLPHAPPSLGQGFRDRPVNAVIQTSDSYQNLNQVVRQMLDEIAKNPGIVSPDVDLRLNKPGMHIDIDREKAADMGVAVDVVARAIETMLGGRNVTRYKRDAEQIRRDRADPGQRPHPRPRTSTAFMCAGATTP